MTDVPVIDITPPSGWLDLNFRELWQFRELVYFFVWRDVKIRYKQTAIGAAWAVIQPLATMLVFSLFFGRLAKIRPGEFLIPSFTSALCSPGCISPALSRTPRMW